VAQFASGYGGGADARRFWGRREPKFHYIEFSPANWRRYAEIDSDLGHSASGPEYAKWSLFAPIPGAADE
jgi:hypothetical protein